MKITFVVVAALVATLAGCAGPGSPSTAETATSTPRPIPSISAAATPRPVSTGAGSGESSTAPVAPPAAVEATVLRILGTGIQLEGAAGEYVAFLSYWSDPSIALAAVSEHTGVTPVLVANTNRTALQYEFSTYDFGGFYLAVNGTGDYRDYRGWQWALATTVTSVGELTIATPGGLNVGDPIADSLTALGQEASPPDPTYGTYAFDIAGGTHALVTFHAAAGSALVTDIYAPDGQ